MSGAIKGVPDHRERFSNAVAALQTVGYDTLNLLDIPGCDDSRCLEKVEGSYHNDGEHTWECYLKYDIIGLMDCDGIAVIPQDSYQSGGVWLETLIGKKLHIPVALVSEWCSNART